MFYCGVFNTNSTSVFIASIGLFIFSTCLYWATVKPIRVRLLIVTEGLFLFIIPFLYTLFGNVLYFKEWKLTNVDRIFPRELFISIMVPDRAPYHIRSGFAVYPPEVMHLYYTYSIQPKNKKERALMGNTYLSKSWKIIKENPWLFIRQRIGKMFFVWEKHYLLYFQKIQHEFEDKLIYWSNIVLLIFGTTGLIIWNNDKKKKMLARIYLTFLIYISLVHSVSLAEDRYSLPGYPLLFIFASFSIAFLWKKAQMIFKK